MFILNFLLFVFLIVLVVVLYFVLHIFLTMKKVKDKFKKYTGSDDGFSQTNSSSRQGDLITDTRDPSKAHRKIIADDEGEYVDFVEE